MKAVKRPKYWQNPLECCGTCTHVSPHDAFIRPGYHAQCSVTGKTVKNARKECCEQFKRKTED